MWLTATLISVKELFLTLPLFSQVFNFVFFLNWLHTIGSNAVVDLQGGVGEAGLGIVLGNSWYSNQDKLLLCGLQWLVSTL